MRVRAWWTSVVLAGVAVACGDQPTEVVPERQTTQGQMTQGPGMIALATSSSDDGLSISTDKDDYSPGDTVWFTGAGWPANDTLDILLEDEPATHEPHTWWVPVGEDGTFRDSTYVVDIGDLGVTFTLTATSRATDRWLTVVFTDGNLQLQPNPTPDPFSPNADGTKDFTTINYRNQGAGTESGIMIRIREGTALGGALVREFSVGSLSMNTNASLNWDGTNNTVPAVVVADGQYGIRVFNGTQTEETASGQRVYIALVDNTPPVISSPLSSPASVNEGSNTAITVTAIATDNPATGVPLSRYSPVSAQHNIDGGTFSSMTVSAGSATNVKNLSATIAGSIIQGLSAGSHLICIRSTDNAGNQSPGTISGNTNCATLSILSDNQAPTADAGTDKSGDEGSPIQLDGSASSDPDGDTPLVFEWAVVTPLTGFDTGATCDLDDASVEQPSITCTDDGVVKVTLRVTDSEGLASANLDEVEVTVKNVKPTVTVSPASRTIAEGGTASFTATVTDPGTNDAPGDFDFAWTTTVSPCSLSGTATITSATFSCNDNAPGGTVKLAVDDGDEDGDSFDEASLTVNNVPPTASGLTTNSPVAEGSDITLALANVFDPSTVDAASLRYAFDCGDGNGYGSATTYATAGATNGASCPTTDNGTRTVKGKVFDKDGGSNEYSASVTITNVPPTIESLKTLNGDPLPASIIIGATLDIKVTFSDPGSSDTHTGQIDCGAGYTDVNGGNDVASPFQTSCTFTTVGSKTIKVKVTDDNGGYDVESHVISVLYNFEGLFAPVDRPNTMNVSKAGQAIPLKWRLTDYQGAPILDFSPAALGVAVSGLQCTISTALDQIEEYAGNSGLQNLGDGYYQFNWKTPSSYANSCKAIGLNLGEGSPRGPLAYFHFKK